MPVFASLLPFGGIQRLFSVLDNVPHLWLAVSINIATQYVHLLTVLHFEFQNDHVELMNLNIFSHHPSELHV